MNETEILQRDAAHYNYLTAIELNRPSIFLRATVSKDGNMYCCLYGENLMEGIAAFGKTPNEATLNFDKVWFNGEEKK